MASQSSPELDALFQRVAAGKHTPDDLNTLRKMLRKGGSDVLQIGKYNVNIGEGQNIQIGDTVYQGANADTIRAVLLQALPEALQQEGRKTRAWIVGSAATGVLVLIGALALLLRLPSLLVDGRNAGPGLFTNTSLSPQVGGLSYFLSDVAAGDGYVWFATREGLVLHRASDGSTERIAGVEGEVQTVVVGEDGRTVWFSLSNGRLGHYTAGDDQAEFATLEDQDGQPLNLAVLSILVMPDNQVWLGDSTLGLVARQGDAWEPVSRPPEVAEVFQALHVRAGSGSSVWVTDGLYAYHYQDGAWSHLGAPNTNGKIPQGVIYDVAVDEAGRVWFAHSSGISVLVKGGNTPDVRDDDWLQCTSDLSPLPPGQVVSLAVSGNAVWLATEHGLASVEVGEDLPEACAQWHWQSWPETDASRPFWGTYQIGLALDEDAASQTLDVWLINREVGNILTFRVP